MILLFGFLSFLGFADATYLAVKHFQHAVPPCSLLTGCETVLTSQYATIWGVPVALLGAGFYLTLLLLTVWYLDRGDSRSMLMAGRLTWAGLLASLYFVTIQLVVLKALCLYCMVSAGISLSLFILGQLILHRLQDKTHTQSAGSSSLKKEI